MNSLKEKGRIYLPLFVGCMLFAFIVYFLLISQGLVNSDDGLWEYNYYKAGKWSLSLGRWFWLYLDRLRFGVHTEPITSLISLVCYSAGLIVMLDLFVCDPTRKTTWLACALLLSSVSVCITLTYRFMSPTFGLSFLLAITAVWVIIKMKKTWLAILGGGTLISLSVGLYQSNIGCACVVLVGYLLICLRDKTIPLRKVLTDILRGLGGVLVGGIMYVLILNVHLRVFHVALSDYNGANTYSLGNAVQNIIFNLTYTYRIFCRYYFENYFKLNVLQNMRIYWLVCLVVLVFFMKELWHIFKVSKVRAMLFAILTALIPVACNAVLMITTGVWVSLQMTVPLALCIPVLVCVGSKSECVGRVWPWVRRMSILVLLLVLYGNFYQLQIDQEAMRGGKVSTTALAEMILDELVDTGNLDPDAQYCVLGSAGGSEIYEFTKITEQANSYALFGYWNRDFSCMRRSWQGVFSYLCGVHLDICSVSDYGWISQEKAVQDMPVFPQEGSIIRIGDIVVVKVSE